MKSAEEWAKDFWNRDFNGPTPAVNDCFVRMFMEIQADALEFAGQMMTANAADTQKAFEEIHNMRVRLMEGKR